MGFFYGKVLTYQSKNATALATDLFIEVAKAVLVIRNHLFANWDIPSMIIEIKKPIIPGMDIPRKRYIPVTEIWRLIFQGIEKVTSNHRL